MFCSKCGKTIDDNAPFCGFCGAPTGVAPAAAPTAVPQPAPQPVPQPTDVQSAVPQPAPQPVPQPTDAQSVAPQYTAPQPTNVQNGAPQYNAPQNGMYQPQPQGQFTNGFNLNLDAKTTDLINKGIRGVLAILALLVVIGAIGSMAVAGAISSAFTTGSFSDNIDPNSMQAFYNLARVPAIIAFVISLAGLAFTMITKQRSLFSYISAGAGLILFIFNFVMYGGYLTLAKSMYGVLGSLFGGSYSGPNVRHRSKLDLPAPRRDRNDRKLGCYHYEQGRHHQVQA